MKYVVMKDREGKEEIFIFPASINHDCIAEVLGRIKNKTHGSWLRIFREPVSAGFTDGVRCTGRSESLNLDSRFEVDAALIQL